MHIDGRSDQQLYLFMASPCTSTLGLRRSTCSWGSLGCHAGFVCIYAWTHRYGHLGIFCTTRSWTLLLSAQLYI